MEIRRFLDRHIPIMGFPLLVRGHFYIESGPGCFVWIWARFFKHVYILSTGKFYWIHIDSLNAGNSPVTAEFPSLQTSDLVSTNCWINNRDAGYLRRNHTHYDVTEMLLTERTQQVFKSYFIQFYLHCQIDLNCWIKGAVSSSTSKQCYNVVMMSS